MYRLPAVEIAACAARERALCKPAQRRAGVIGMERRSGGVRGYLASSTRFLSSTLASVRACRGPVVFAVSGASFDVTGQGPISVVAAS